MPPENILHEPPGGPKAETPSIRPLRRRFRTRSIVWMALEVLLISIGVFLGLAGEQWRGEREERQKAAESLQRFRSEITANRNAIAAVKDYHATKLQELRAYFAADAERRKSIRIPFEGLQPPNFERTAWDLALATQSLAYIEPDLAFVLSRTYSYQAMTTDLGRGVMQSMYLRPPSDTDMSFLSAVRLYYEDLVVLEPGLIAAYDELLKQIDGVLAE